MSDEEERQVIKDMGLPSWFTPEMLRPGVPVIVPKEAEKTTIIDDFGMHERYPGAWQDEIMKKQTFFGATEEANKAGKELLHLLFDPWLIPLCDWLNRHIKRLVEPDEK